MFVDLDPDAAKVGLKIHPYKTKIQHNNIGYGVGAKEAKCYRITAEIFRNQVFSEHAFPERGFYEHGFFEHGLSEHLIFNHELY